MITLTLYKMFIVVAYRLLHNLSGIYIWIHELSLNFVDKIPTDAGITLTTGMNLAVVPSWKKGKQLKYGLPKFKFINMANQRIVVKVHVGI